MIKPEDAAPLRILHSEIGGWDVGSTHAGKHDQAFISAWAGKSWRACIEAQWKAGESFRNMREKLLVEFNNARLENAKLTRTVGELETTIAAQKKQIDDTAMMLASMKSAADNALSDTPALPDPATPKEPSWFVRLLAKLLVPKG